MKFTYETLKDLKHGDLCLVKYSTVVKPELAKAGTLEPLSQLNINRYPIFNETKRNCMLETKRVVIEFQFKGFSIFIDEKTISKIIPPFRKNANKNFYVTFSEKDVDITLPYYTIQGEIDKDGYPINHIIMTSGHELFDFLINKVKCDLGLAKIYMYPFNKYSYYKITYLDFL